MLKNMSSKVLKAMSEIEMKQVNSSTCHLWLYQPEVPEVFRKRKMKKK